MGTTASSKRPVLNIPLSQVEMALEVIAVAGVVYGFVTLWLSWPTLPDRIPHHFGASGKPDAWGDKGILWTLPVVSVLLYAALTTLSRYPHIFNYPWAITEQNAERQYRLSRSLVCWIKVEVVWVFSFLVWKTVQVALGQAAGLGVAFLPMLLSVLFGTIGIYLWKAYRAR